MNFSTIRISDMTINPLEYDAPIEPPFYGTSQLISWEPKTLLGAIDQQCLLSLFSEGQSGTVSPSSDTELSEFGSALDGLSEEIESKNLMDPTGLYGYFPVITDDDNIIILDPSDYSTEQAVLRFPRIPGKENRSFADYLRPEGDLIAVQMVTLGARFDEWIAANANGPARFMAEYLVRDLADRVTSEIVRGLMLPEGTGRRIDFGSPGMPGGEDQAKLFELLAIEERMGVVLTEEFKMVPGCSLMGVYIRHSGAGDGL
jgi:5-methyltetrahydrofolate--homocysteine methyltransferase